LFEQLKRRTLWWVRPLRKPGILIVEDLDEMRELFGEVFMAEGYHSIMARSGVEAFTRMEAILPDVVVTDLMMPEMNGGELVRRMRRHPRLRTIPVILLTASDETKALEELGEAATSVRRILRKPVSLSDLLTAVDSALVGDPQESG
jgi:CheY-like chemotaxis protein